MKEISQHEAEAMDAILAYLIENKSGGLIYSGKIWKDVFPEQDEEFVYFLLKKIMNTAGDIVVKNVRSNDISNFEVFFEANAITERYLEQQGGFSKQFQNDQIEKLERERIERLQTEKLESEVDITKFQKGLGKRLTIWGVVLTVLSILVSFLTSLFQTQPYQDYDSKVDSLTQVVSLTTQKLDVLTDSLKSLNLRLELIEELNKKNTVLNE